MYRVSLWLERATFAAADTVISTNESYRAVAIARGAKDPSRVIVVRSGPSLARFVRVAPEPALKDGFAHLVCYLGVMGPNDGLDHLLDAAAHVVHDRGRADVLFVLIGSGDCHPRLVARAAELNLVRNVRFVGRIPDQDVIRYLSTADVGVAPDPKDPLNDLSTMNKILEYMAVGLPVAAFDLVEARVSAGEAGAYARASDPAALGDLVLDLIADPARRQRMGDAGLRRFRDSLAWEHQAPRLLGAYSMLLGRTPAPVRSVV
jgi:asparagine synthase (glutamine-hydrolysing)